MSVKKRVGILISGRGSNMRALIEAARGPDYPAEIVLVVSNVASAPGLTFAREAGVATAVIGHKAFDTREAFDAAITDELRAANVGLICNAGFMRLHSAAFVQHWSGRQLNIHPSLLPSFRGLHPQRQALDAGVRISGCTVHFVSEEVDAGAIVAQGAVPVLASDNVERLSARILALEHQLYPLALSLVAGGAVGFEYGKALTVTSGTTALFPNSLIKH